MVRQCQAEESISTYIDSSLHQRTSLEVGLLIGRLGTARDYLLFLVKTPSQDGVEPVATQSAGSSRGSTTGGNLRLDVEWIAEHAAQIKSMLPGGVAVVGAYLLASDQAFAATAPQLTSLAKALRTEASDDSLLLHIDAVTGKPSLKENASGASSGMAGLKPVELRFTKVLPGFQALRCSLAVDLSTPVPKGPGSLSSRFSGLIQQEASRIAAGTALLNGMPLDTSKPLSELLPADALPEEAQRVELLCPPTCAATAAAGAQHMTTGRIQLAGVLEGIAFLPRREPASAVVPALRDNFAASLRHRLEAVVEEAEAVVAEEGIESHPLLAPPSAVAVVAPALPVRVFMPTVGGVPIYDYLMEGESAADALTRAKEVLGISLASDATITGSEGGAVSDAPALPWDPVGDQDTRVRNDKEKELGFWERMPLWLSLLLWVAVGLLSAAVAMPISKRILEYPFAV